MPATQIFMLSTTRLLMKELKGKATHQFQLHYGLMKIKSAVSKPTKISLKFNKLEILASSWNKTHIFVKLNTCKLHSAQNTDTWTFTHSFMNEWMTISPDMISSYPMNLHSPGMIKYIKLPNDYIDSTSKKSVVTNHTYTQLRLNIMHSVFYLNTLIVNYLTSSNETKPKSHPPSILSSSQCCSIA